MNAEGETCGREGSADGSKVQVRSQVWREGSFLTNSYGAEDRLYQCHSQC